MKRKGEEKEKEEEEEEEEEEDKKIETIRNWRIPFINKNLFPKNSGTNEGTSEWWE